MILATGGAGMTGSFVVQELLARGHEVRVLTTSVQKARGIDRIAGAELVEGRFEDSGSLREAASGVSAIVHFAVTGAALVNIVAMATLLDAWERGPFVFMSSVDVYAPGAVKADVFTETSRRVKEGNTHYGAQKAICEELLEATAAGVLGTPRRPYSILRGVHIWGPDARYLKMHTLGKLFSKAMQGQPIVLPGAAEEEWRSYQDAWVDPRDLAWVAAECLETPLNEAVNVLGEHFNWHDVCRHLVDHAITPDGAEVRHTASLGGFLAESNTSSQARLQERLGFTAEHTLARSTKELLDLASREDA